MAADSGAQGTGQMRAALAPVQTGTADGSGAAGGGKNAERLHLRLTDFCQDSGVAVDFDRTAGAQGIGDADPKRPREMVIAGACPPQGRVPGSDTGQGTGQRYIPRDLHDAFDHPRDLGTGKAVIAVASLFVRRDQPDRGEPGEMAAGRLRHDCRDLGQFGGRQGAPVHQGRQHGGTSRLAHGGGHFGNAVRCGHGGLRLRGSLAQIGIECFGFHRSIPVRVAGRTGMTSTRVPTMPQPARTARPFFGWHVVAATFLLAIFGWGAGFYGPPVFLYAVVARTGWPVAMVSAAVTVHFLFGAEALRPQTVPAKAPARRSLLRDRKFLTLAAGMMLGLFAQIGLLAHLFSLLVPVLGEGLTGLAMGGATLAAILGRSMVGRMMPATADRRLVACASYGVQVAGSLLFILAAGDAGLWLFLGTALFGLGIGNATSLPPLIAQQEFSPAETARVVPLIVAIGQAGYAFAPAAFGLLRPGGMAGTEALFLCAATIQLAAISCLLAGRGSAARINAETPVQKVGREDFET